MSTFLFVCFIGSLDQATQVLEETEKVNSGLEMVGKLLISNTNSAPSVLGIPRVTKTSKLFQGISSLHTL